MSFAENFLHYLLNNKLEVFAFILSVAGVWLTAKEKVINWPIAIIACAIYAYIFYGDALYGDAALQVFYVIISFYGWREWLYGGTENQTLQISRAPRKTVILLIFISIPAGLLLGKLLSYTNSNVPYLDGITTALSLAATWMMAKKLFENWLVWIFTDIIYVATYMVKELYITSVLYFIFTLLAIYGHYSWKKQLQSSYA